MSRKMYEIEHRMSPPIMTGTERSRMRRRPIPSTISKAIIVQTRLVTAIDKEVKVGEEKPMREKMVAEKYIREFWVTLVDVVERRGVGMS